METHLRGKRTSVISFSIDLETLNYLDGYAHMNYLTRSQAIRYHLRLARQYMKIMKKQEQDVNTAKDSEERDTVIA